uniref:Uncharacterized protein n=1 Tax=Arundo donax TaxID=35708 RepID=A0A0A9BNU7_ARUDO
MCVPTVASTL